MHLSKIHNFSFFVYFLEHHSLDCDETTLMRFYFCWIRKKMSKQQEKESYEWTPTEDEFKQHSRPQCSKPYVRMIILDGKNYRRVPVELLKPYLLHLDGTYLRIHQARQQQFMKLCRENNQIVRPKELGKIIPWPQCPELNELEFKKVMQPYEYHSLGFDPLDSDEEFFLGQIDY